MKAVSVVALSGGMDSAVVLASAIEDAKVTWREVHAVSFRYGSKHNRFENQAAEKLAHHFGVNFKIMDVSTIFSSFSSNLLMSGGPIPEGHYEAESMSLTVVPGRNIIFGSILAGLAWSLGGEGSKVWMGVHSGDHAIYEDCRPGFIDAFKQAVNSGTGNRVDIVAPFLWGNKTTIIKRGIELGVPFELTRTCYKDQPIACGKCGSCQERLEAFRNNGIEDPVEYEFRGVLSN